MNLPIMLITPMQDLGLYNDLYSYDDSYKWSGSTSIITK